MLRVETDGLVIYQFESLAIEGLVHAVFTRLGGVSQGPFATLNVSENVGDEPAAVAENRRRIYAHLGLEAGQVVLTGQVHGSHVARVGVDDGGRTLPNTDGLLTDAPNVALLLRFADCQPILLYDPAHHALGLAHAGWRGVALGIARRAVEAMQEAFGSQPGDLVAGLGPAIGPCCYTVGHEVAAAMGYALPHWKRVMHVQGEDTWRFDLPAANAQHLAAAGVRHIEQAGLCTTCRRDEFFSHRADGGQTGRFATVAYLQPKAGAGRALEAELPRQESQRGLAVGVDWLHPPGFPPFGEVEGEET